MSEFVCIKDFLFEVICASSKAIADKFFPFLGLLFFRLSVVFFAFLVTIVFFIFSLIEIRTSSFASSLATYMQQTKMAYVSYLFILAIFFFLALWLYLNTRFVGGYARVLLGYWDTGKLSFNLIFLSHRLAWRVLGAFVLYVLMAVIGMALFIVPGIYVMIRFPFFIYAIFDKNASIIESFRISWQLTKGYSGILFAFGSMQVLLFGVAQFFMKKSLLVPLVGQFGAYVLGFIGAIFYLLMILLTNVAWAYVYRKLSPKAV